MIPTAPFTPRVITMSQCPIGILDCRLNSRIPLFHWSLSQSYDAWCTVLFKRRSRDHFRYKISITVLAGSFKRLFQLTFSNNSAVENDSSD